MPPETHIPLSQITLNNIVEEAMKAAYEAYATVNPKVFDTVAENLNRKIGYHAFRARDVLKILACLTDDETKKRITDTHKSLHGKLSYAYGETEADNILKKIEQEIGHGYTPKTQVDPYWKSMRGGTRHSGCISREKFTELIGDEEISRLFFPIPSEILYIDPHTFNGFSYTTPLWGSSSGRDVPQDIKKQYFLSTEDFKDFILRRTLTKQHLLDAIAEISGRKAYTSFSQAKPDIEDILGKKFDFAPVSFLLLGALFNEIYDAEQEQVIRDITGKAPQSGHTAFARAADIRRIFEEARRAAPNHSSNSRVTPTRVPVRGFSDRSKGPA